MIQVNPFLYSLAFQDDSRALIHDLINFIGNKRSENNAGQLVLKTKNSTFRLKHFLIVLKIFGARHIFIMSRLQKRPKNCERRFQSNFQSTIKQTIFAKLIKPNCFLNKLTISTFALRIPLIGEHDIIATDKLHCRVAPLNPQVEKISVPATTNLSTVSWQESAELRLSNGFVAGIRQTRVSTTRCFNLCEEIDHYGILQSDIWRPTDTSTCLN